MVAALQGATRAAILLSDREACGRAIMACRRSRVCFAIVQSDAPSEALRSTAEEFKPTVVLADPGHEISAAGLTVAGRLSPPSLLEEGVAALKTGWGPEAYGCDSELDVAGEPPTTPNGKMDRVRLEETSERGPMVCPEDARFFDLGGGFPWPFASDAPPPNLAPLTSSMHDMAHSVPANRELWFETGRYLTASPGTLPCTVLEVKGQPDQPKKIFLDAGVHVLGDMPGTRRIPHAQTAVTNLSAEEGSSSHETADVLGPLCTPADWLSRSAPFERIRVRAELVQISNVGAYGLTASLTGFL